MCKHNRRCRVINNHAGFCRQTVITLLKYLINHRSFPAHRINIRDSLNRDFRIGFQRFTELGDQILFCCFDRNDHRFRLSHLLHSQTADNQFIDIIGHHPIIGCDIRFAFNTVDQ
ncbi:hypothetical protein SDC9_177229 [bioreactor metagenome]|uniref:Uncharacterized protein n=1 Tax=bioreactor metagenome TaxID=1076179 RepID=A0A645GU52_9ZZZZ